MKRNALTLLLILLSLTIYSQPYCNVKTFNLRDGLASSVITCIAQTPDQLMWFSTWNGLTCYDGYRFTNYRDQGNKRTLSTNRLLNIEPSQTGNLWCITYDQNPYIFDRRSSQFINIGNRINKKYDIDFHTNRALSMKNGHTWLLNVEKSGPVIRVDDRNLMNDDAIEKFQAGTAQIPGTKIIWVIEDHDGDEWLITDNGVSLLGSNFHDTTPFRFIQQVGSIVYLATNDGRISQYEKKKQKLTPLLTTTRKIYNLIEAAGRWIVASTDEGLTIYDTRLKTHYDIVQPYNQGRTMMADNHGRLWTLDEGSGNIALTQLTDNTQFSFATSSLLPAIAQSTQNLIYEDNHHTIWIATAQGFFGYYDEQRHHLVPCPVRTSNEQPIILRWLNDQQGNLWFAGDHDLALASTHYRHITHVNTLQEVRSVMFDHEGRIWAGTMAGHIAIYSASGKLQGYLSPNGRIQTEPVRFSTHIYCLYEDRNHHIWIGTKGDGLYYLGQNQLAHYQQQDQPGNYSLPSNQIYDVHQDHRGRIWVGTFERGICLIDNIETGHVLYSPTDFKNYPIEDFHKVRRITETHDSVLIVSCSNGLVVFSEHFSHPASLKFYAHKHIVGDSTSLLTSDVMQTCIAHDNAIYVATVGGGIQTILEKNLLQPKLTFSSINQLLSDNGTVLTMVQDRNHNLWIGRENSIDMTEQATGQLWRFGPSHIGEHTEMTEALPAYDPQTGQLALATTDGFVCFHPERLQDDKFVPPVVFTGVQLHDEHETQRMLLVDSLEVNADQRNLTIHFAALDYQDNYMIRYAYKLEGVDHDWNNLGSEHSISFSNLPHGRHRLLVRSTNSQGLWAENVSTLYIYAHPTFWETWWAKLLYVLLGLSIVGIAVWIYRLYIRASMEHKLNDMKTQFFTDVSHKLRTPLTLIGGPVMQVLQEGTLSSTARFHLEMVERNARRMLELVNKMLTYSKEHHTYISDEHIETAKTEYNESPEPHSTDLPATDAAKPTRLLIVEDNDDLRAFLSSILKSDYDVTQATNGREGLEKAKAELPDFILTDVMMPEMDGLTMVHHIKADKNISHIPIVILSAKASMDDRIEGLKAGVNDYITKPFSATYLKQRMQNIISNQRMLQQTYLEQMGQAAPIAATPADPDADDMHTIRLAPTNIVDSDKEMMERLLAYIDQNISNPDLKIEDLASAVFLGRTVFYNKIRTLVGMSPVELLRHIRIQRAEDMVAKSNEPFSQIAYAVGFSDSRYFGKCFKKQTGLTPSEYREQHI